MIRLKRYGTVASWSLVLCVMGSGILSSLAATKNPEPPKVAAPVKEQPAGAMQKAESKEESAAVTPNKPAEEAQSEEKVAVAKPVDGDPVRIYGWRETIQLEKSEQKLVAKLDTGALTSSIHAENKELFERDGKKWVRFFVSDPKAEKPVKHKIEAPLVRIARIKEPGSESVPREVVRLAFQIGDRKMRGEFTLNNRVNMNAPVLLGRSIIVHLGWVDASRTDLADQQVFR